ncbi:spermidine/putrescine transport system substrate-binding protein [Bacteroides reticulotermitis]|uniref:Spermidine/putrescine transport system substrate-binding protein n=1 Tax=Bacteroides reticulotermitis TaxID=1133319 RepID=A0A840D314_9BACE|nr:ABC transporter substrate-binding protein [Bacteroides reticulotermitis]MBB4045421.1 spermidine/putrescine transport system substrate-binding protein [Bacteroides reticulotermitis]
MKKILFLILPLCLLAGCYNSGVPRENVLKIYNWADYIGDSVLEDFQAYYKEQTGEDIRIVYQTFDINEIMLTKIEKGHEDFDVVCPSEYIIERMLKKKLLLPIDTNFGSSSNYLGNVAPYIREQIDKLSQPGEAVASHYAVCYMWGTAGILYNRAFVPDSDATSWECLWDKKYAGKILMKDSYRDAYGTAVIYAHAQELAEGKTTVEALMNDYSPRAMEIAEQYLKALKPNISGWEADFGKEMMTKNKAYLNMTWSGDAIWAIEEASAVGVDLDYTVPKEGSNIWYDGWVIPKYAKNTKAASYFINFMCRSDIALRNMDFCGYVSSIATPEVQEAKTDTTLDYYSDLSYFFGPGADSIQIDKIQYPDRKVVERCAMIRDFGDKTRDVLDIWSRIKGDNLGAGITILIFVVVGLMSGWMIYKRWERYKRRQLQRRRSRRKKTRGGR